MGEVQVGHRLHLGHREVGGRRVLVEGNNRYDCEGIVDA